MLRFAEEILLLLLSNEGGDIVPSLPPHSLNTVLAGAVLMDLALENRIDTDLERLMLIDPTPVGDELLDPTLAEIAQDARAYPVGHWLGLVAMHGDEIREQALSRLVQRSILESGGSTLFFLSNNVSRSKRYPVIDGEATEEVQFRIMRLLFSDDIPDPRDIVIISLAAACDVFECILSRDELAEVQDRIDHISKMDLIGQSVARALRSMGPPPRPAPSIRPPEEIPQVSGWPLVGSAFDMAGDLRSFLTRQYRKHGPIFQIRALNRRYISLVGPEANRFVQKQGRSFLRSHETWQGFNMAMGAKDALTAMDGPAHIRMRKVQMSAYSQKSIEHRLDEVVDITRRMIAEWPQNRPVVTQYAMQNIIAEQIAILTTGISAEDSIDDLITTLDGLLRVHVMRQSPGWILRLPRLRRARKRVEELHTMVLAHHEREDRANRDLIDDLLELHRTDPQFFPETDLQLAVLGPFFAGIETAANTCAFMIYAILKHPELLERITAEADAFFDQETLTPERLRELDVMHRTVLETLRMYPAIPGLPRTVANSFEFAGYKVPARSKVIIGNTVTHHLSECFPNPQRFDIDRYTAERAEHKQPGAFAPFGLGTHRCLGSNFAEVQIALTLLTIVHDLELTLASPGYKLKVKQTPAPHPASSFKFRVLRRRQSSH